MSKKQTYLVTGLATVSVVGKDHSKPGSPVELTPDEARPLLAKGYLRVPKATTKPEPRG